MMAISNEESEEDHDHTRQRRWNARFKYSASTKHPRARSDYDKETAYESYMNPEPGFQSGPGDSVDAD